MGDRAMALREEGIQGVGDYVKPWIRELVESAIPRRAVAGVDAQLLERMVRVEEELKAQRELMDERFAFTKERYLEVNESFKRTQWFIGIGFIVVTTAVVTVFGVLA